MANSSNNSLQGSNRTLDNLPSQPSINVHASPSLDPFRLPLKDFVSQEGNDYVLLVVGGCIFADVAMSKLEDADNGTLANANARESRLLLIQRGAKETNRDRWEVPGGGVDNTDHSILHALNREVFEETGLHVTHVNHLVSKQENSGRRGKYCKWTFEVEVDEIHGRATATTEAQEEPSCARIVDLDKVPVLLDPKEHQAYRWFRTDQIEEVPITSTDQKRIIARAFDIYGGKSGSMPLEIKATASPWVEAEAERKAEAEKKAQTNGKENAG